MYSIRYPLACALGAIALVFAVATPAFAATPRVSSARITSPNVVTIVYTEPVYTNLADYGTFTGSLSNASLSSVSGSGSNIVTLTFAGTPFASTATGGLTISSNVHSTADNASLGGGPFNVTDGQAPLLSSFSMSSNLANGTVARTGDVLTVTFSGNESLSSVSTTIANHQVSASGYGAGPYTASYTLTSSDTQDTVPVSVTFTDAAGNMGNGSFMLGGGLGPRITSITSDATTAGTLNAGSTILFTLMLASPVPNAYVTGSYNGIQLTWTTNNGGATYNATYTVQNTHPSTSAPLQISNVTVRDPSGNVSVPASGYDVMKTINSQSFTISMAMAVSSPVPSGTQPRFGFYSPVDGTFTYGGSCTGVVLSAITGDNYISFNTLPDGVYSNCTITAMNYAGYKSNTLAVPTFVVGSGYVPTTVTTPTTPSSTDAIYAYVFTKALDVGSEGAEVTALQKLLKAEGLLTATPNGYFGQATRAAVKAFQKLHGIKQQGNVGPATRAALNAL